MEASWRMAQRPLCCSCAVLSWFWGPVFSQYSISMRWMSRWSMLRSLGRCSLGKVDLPMAGSAAEVLPASPNAHCHFKKFTPSNTSLLLFCINGDWSNQYSIWTGGKPVSVWDAGLKEALWYKPNFNCIRNLKILHSQLFVATYVLGDKSGSRGVCFVALNIMLHAKLFLLVNMFFICLCWHPERMCRSLSSCGQIGQVRLSKRFNHTACVWLYKVPVLNFIIITPFKQGHRMLLGKGC